MQQFFKEKKIIIFTVIFTLFLLISGYYSSPSFSQEQSFLNAIGTFIALIFVFSVMVILSAVGFNFFAIFLGIFLAMAISLYGVEAGVITILMTYLVWGLIFAIELLLVHNGNRNALEWFKNRYSKRAFEIEYRAFYPVLWVFYFLFDIIPHYIFGDKKRKFYPQKLKKELMDFLD